MSRACEECEEEPGVEPLPGSASLSGGPDALSELLLELTAGALRAAILLAEADNDDWQVVGGRLAAFRGIVEQFPTSPRARRRLGFRVEPKPKPKRKRR